MDYKMRSAGVLVIFAANMWTVLLVAAGSIRPSISGVSGPVLINPGLNTGSSSINQGIANNDGLIASDEGTRDRSGNVNTGSTVNQNGVAGSSSNIRVGPINPDIGTTFGSSPIRSTNFGSTVSNFGSDFNTNSGSFSNVIVGPVTQNGPRVGSNNFVDSFGQIRSGSSVVQGQSVSGESSVGGNVAFGGQINRGRDASQFVQSTGLSNFNFNQNQESDTVFPADVFSGSDGRVITGSDGRVITGSDGRVITGSDGRVITGSDGRVITLSGIGGQSGQTFFGSSQGTGSQIRFPAQGFAGQSGINFAQILPPQTLTVTDTTTIDRFFTVTETILNSVPVTITGFTVDTITVTTRGLHQTDVDDIVALTTTVVERPITEFVTTAKSNFVHVTEVSVDIFTITHSAHLISQTTFTTIVTQTMTLSSPIVRTSLSTDVATSIEYRTVVNTVFSHGYN